MTKSQQKKFRENLEKNKDELQQAKEIGDQKEISLAAANLGLTQFQIKKPKEGNKRFQEAERIAKELDDFDLLVRCLGLKTLAYQIAEQFPNAFKTAQKIQALAESHDDLGIQSDSLATQGQILIDSGDELGALEKLNAAQEILERINDKRRLMNLMGAFGNYSLMIAAAERAKSYFEQARDLARDLEDRQAEIGFHGNLGTVLEWEGNYSEAGQTFIDVLEFLQETDNLEAQLHALHHLTQVYSKKNDDIQIIKFAKMGIQASQQLEDNSFIFTFFEKLIPAYYRLEQIDEANEATSQAIETARVSKDKEKEVSFLTSLGESYFLSEMLDQALETYQQALEGAQRLQRQTDYAYLLGRIGVVLAELGKTDEAISYHNKAIKYAKENNLSQLEGEQLTMLAMAQLDINDLEDAKINCEEAIKVYSDANLNEEAEKARELLNSIKA